MTTWGDVGRRGVEQGGTVEIVDESDGQVGYCNLPDGTRVEEWEYFRQMTGATQP